MSALVKISKGFNKLLVMSFKLYCAEIYFLEIRLSYLPQGMTVPNPIVRGAWKEINTSTNFTNKLRALLGRFIATCVLKQLLKYNKIKLIKNSN